MKHEKTLVFDFLAIQYPVCEALLGRSPSFTMVILDILHTTKRVGRGVRGTRELGSRVTRYWLAGDDP